MKKIAIGYVAGVASVVVAFAAILILDDDGGVYSSPSEFH